MFPDELIEHNRTWADGRQARPLPAVAAMPLAVVACYDPRLDDLLHPALGLAEGEGFLLRAAGATVDAGLLRSLTLAVYLFDVRQVLVLGHSSCRMASFPTADFVGAFRRRGVAREAFGAGDLRAWAGAIGSPRQGVLDSVAAIRAAPFLPGDLTVAGGVLDDTTGRIELVFRPDDPTPAGADLVTAEPPPVPAAAVEEIIERAAPAAEPSGPQPAPADDPLATVRQVVHRLLDEHGLRDELAQLRLALGQEMNPVRQLHKVQKFVRAAAAESPQVRAAFEELRQTALSPRLLQDLIGSLLSARRPRSKP